LGGSIAAAIVDDDDLRLFLARADPDGKRFEKSREVPFFVIGGNDEADHEVTM
jgi:hypothetical protein